ncbi:alpha-protein kinase 3 isoform X2 [Chiloscyllium punctatum]|uniref:alpha-protein kinase 3 isoform X2 n=1 Tax=Chiloscyllium punctatum TaxID=137246 RepID=UPI003B6378C8
MAWCTEDDAAIYQASARNSKGIVSCSGLLEVGQMNEYKIHQRWFARLKQKADSKKRELEETWTRGKENVALVANAPRHDLLRMVSPERAQRKRKSQGPGGANSFDSLRNGEDVVKVRIPDSEGAPQAKMADMARRGAVSKPPPPLAPEIQNGYLVGPQGKPPENNSAEEPVGNGIFSLSYPYQASEHVVPQPRGKEFAASKKKRRLSREEGEVLSVGKTEEGQWRDENDWNGVNGNEGLLGTLGGNEFCGDGKPIKSRDRMEIDEQASSVTPGHWQPSTGTSGPTAEDTEATHSTNDTTFSIDQEPVYPSLQTPVRDMYFSVKDMFFETTQEPERQSQLPQPMETVAQTSTQEHVNPLEVCPAQSVDPFPLIDVTLRGDPNQTQESKDMGTSRIEMDIVIPSVLSEIQNKGAPDSDISSTAQQSSEDIGLGNSGDSLEAGPPHTDISKAQDGSPSPPCISEAKPPPAVQTPCLLADVVRPEVKASSPPPPVQAEPVAEGLRPASPRQQLATGTLAEAVEGKNQTQYDISPVSESTGNSVCSLNSEWEKLDFLSTSEPTDISDEPRTPETTTSEGTQPELRDSTDEDVLLPPSNMETQLTAERRNQLFQPICQDVLALETGTEAMEVTGAGRAGDQLPVLDVSEPTSPEGSVSPEENQPDIPAALMGRMLSDLALPLVQASAVDTILSTDSKVSEETVAEGDDEFLKVDRAEEAGAEERAQRSVPSDSFGAHLVEKFLSYLKIPSFLLGDRTPPGDAGKAEATPNASEIVEPSSQAEGLATLGVTPSKKAQPSLEEDLASSLPVGPEGCLVSEGPLSAAPQADGGHTVPSTEGDFSPGSTLPVESSLETGISPALAAVLPPSTPESNHPPGTPLSLPPSRGAAEEPLEDPCLFRTELNLTEGPEVPGTPALPDVSRLHDAGEGQGMADLSSTEGEPAKNTAPCLEGMAGERSVVEGDPSHGNNILEVLHTPDSEVMPVPEPVTPRTDGIPSTSNSQVPKSISLTHGPEVSQVPSIVVDTKVFKDEVVAAKIEDEEALQKDMTSAAPLLASGSRVTVSDSTPAIPSATPAELAAGARRKIFLPRSRLPEEAEGGGPTPLLTPPAQPKKEEGVKRIQQAGTDHPDEGPSPFLLTPRRSGPLLQAPAAPQQAALTERRSPTTPRRMATLEVPRPHREAEDQSGSSPTPRGVTTKDAKAGPVKTEVKTEESKLTKNLFKAPQVIRKIRVEQYSDATGNLKLWCQFFNILSESTIMWQKDGVHLDKLNQSAGDESQVSLAIVQASVKDHGLYRCAVENEYGSDATDFLLSSEVLSGFNPREEIEVGEEIEMTPMLITKGLTDAGFLGNKLFGRIMMKEPHFGSGVHYKANQVKVIYGLEPIFESGATCIIKVQKCISYGTKKENSLIARNHDITMQACKLQNTAREYSKIFAAETRAVETFGPVPEVIPLYLLYRPANNIPYATIEKDLNGQFTRYSMEDKGKNLSESEIGQKCHTFQHWIYQWTNGNLLITDLQGVGLNLTDVQIATTPKGYQGLTGNSPLSAIEEFVTAHQCNHYCEALGLKSIDSLQPAKPKGSKSPLTTRKVHSAQSSPQIQRKGQSSPQVQRKDPQSSPRAQRKVPSSPQPSRKTTTSPGVSRRAGNTEDSHEPAVRHKTVEIPKSVKLR